MLLRFAVSNHLSIKDTQELSFIKSALKGPEEGLLYTSALPKDKVLPAAIIYGPNASGKSNLLDALEFMRSAVLFSQRGWAPDAGVPRKPFLLRKACLDKSSHFDMDFVADGVRYNYGFACSDTEFTEEWLYEAPLNRRRMIFERSGASPDTLKFGTSFTGQKQVIAQLMRPNSLFLSAAFQNNHPLASNIVLKLQEIRAGNSLSINAAALSVLLKNEKLDTRVLSFLKDIGTGISGYREVITDRSDEEMRTFRAIIEAIWQQGDKTSTDKRRESLFDNMRNNFNVEFCHNSEDGNSIYFESGRESSGTRRLIPLLKDVMSALDDGSVCVIDEIDASLHTQVCEAIIALFTNRTTNPNGAQIIATTHDTNLFNAPSLRRDELWLVEKSPGGASEFYSLADVKVRDAGNYERGYLQGRYGAIPFSGTATELVKGL